MVYNCNLCSDTGVVLYRQVIDQKEYDFAAQCVCRLR